jgi:thymidylate synthase
MDKQYKQLLRTILGSGYYYNDPNRIGTRRLQINDYRLSHSFSEGFPILTSKETYFKGAFSELLVFLRGESDVRDLWRNGVKFWNKDWQNYQKLSDLEATHLKLKFLQKTNDASDNSYSLGKIYPYQMRKWNGQIDQIKNLVATLKSNPMATKKTVTMWNPSDLNNSCLSPCHWSWECLISPLEDGYGLTIKWHQHSTDVFLGLPLNIAYYSGLCYLLAELTNMKPLGIIGDLSNVHLYDNAIEAARKQLKQKSYPLPTFKFSTKAKVYFNKWRGVEGFKDYGYYDDLDNVLSVLNAEDFVVEDYKSSKAIKVEMLAYKNE